MGLGVEAAGEGLYLGCLGFDGFFFFGGAEGAGAVVFGEACGFFGFFGERVLLVDGGVVFGNGAAVAAFGVVADFYWFSKREEIFYVLRWVGGVGKRGEAFGLGFELVGSESGLGIFLGDFKGLVQDGVVVRGLFEVVGDGS